MLKEIHCEKFHQKTIKFNNGLNCLYVSRIDLSDFSKKFNISGIFEIILSL